MSTLDLKGAADFLKIGESTAQEMAARGEIPGARIGHAWVFSVARLEQYLHDQIDRQTSARKKQAPADSPVPAGRLRKRTTAPSSADITKMLETAQNFRKVPA